MSNSSSDSCYASFRGFYYIFFFSVGFFERRACILAFKLAFKTGAATGLTGAAGFTPTTGFLTGDFDTRAWGLATGFAWAGLTILAGAGLATAAGFATACLATTEVLTAGAGLATAT